MITSTIYYDNYDSTATGTMTVHEARATQTRVPTAQPPWPDPVPFVPLMADFDDPGPIVIHRVSPPKFLQPWAPRVTHKTPRQNLGTKNFRKD